MFSTTRKFSFYNELNCFNSSLKNFRSIIYCYVISRTEKRFLRTHYVLSTAMSSPGQRRESEDVFSTTRKFSFYNELNCFNSSLKNFRSIIYCYVISRTEKRFLRTHYVLSTAMSSAGQRRGSCGHTMAGFDTHSKCARCRDKGLGDDPCVLKKECVICKGFTPEQVLQLATPTYRDRKEKKTSSSTTTSSTPTLVDPAHISVLGKVEKVKAVQSTPTTKKTKRSESPKPSASIKRSSSSRPSAEDLKELDDKWAERFFRLEAMLLAKTFTVPVEPVVKPASDVTPTEKPFLSLPPASCLLRRACLLRHLVPALTRPPVML